MEKIQLQIPQLRTEEIQLDLEQTAKITGGDNETIQIPGFAEFQEFINLYTDFPSDAVTNITIEK